MKYHSFIKRKLYFNIIILLFPLLTINGCGLSTQQGGEAGLLSETSLVVLIEPIDSERDPLVFLSEGGDKICRKRVPDETRYGLDPEEAPEDDDEEGENTETSNQPITTSVDTDWFQIGLIIVNKHDSYYAVVKNLIFSFSAKWGSETLRGRQEIPAGYCNSDPLYIVPPTPKGSKPGHYRGELFEPEKADSLNNLILFVSGVPIPTDHPEQEEDDSSETLGNIRSTAQDSANQREQEEFFLTSLPAYTVQLHVIGYWIDKQRNRKAILRKRVTFRLSSKFLN
ncbi:MAG: hypothetical protein OXH36_05515 [Bdellovibrionales bacterium]|nr:hypothetical protein [Bdellovibrionales bacterium]